MADALLVAARFTQYGAAAILFGLSAFRLYGVCGAARPTERRVAILAAISLARGALLALAGRSATMTGDAAAVFDLAAWRDVGAESQVGRSAVLRALCALLALMMVLRPGPGQGRWPATALIGALATASFPWSGHACAVEGAAGWLLLGADLVHVLAASAWLGALVGLAFALAAARRHPAEDHGRLVAALERFSGVGSALVALILVTGSSMRGCWSPRPSYLTSSLLPMASCWPSSSLCSRRCWAARR